MQIVSKERCLLEMLDMSLTTLQFVELDAESVENAADASVICEHHTADFMWTGDIGTLLGQGNLDGSGSPWDEVCQFTFTDSL